MPTPDKGTSKAKDLPRVKNLPFHQRKVKPLATYVLTYMVANGGQTPALSQFKAPPGSVFERVRWVDNDTALAVSLLQDHMSRIFYTDEVIPRSEADVAKHTREMLDTEDKMAGLPWGIDAERKYFKMGKKREQSLMVASRDQKYLQEKIQQIAAKEKAVFDDKRKTEIFFAEIDNEINKRESEKRTHPDLGYLYAIRDNYKDTKWAGG